jgi:hypothetical protein
MSVSLVVVGSASAPAGQVIYTASALFAGWMPPLKRPFFISGMRCRYE